MSRCHHRYLLAAACALLVAAAACQNGRTTYAENAPVPALISDRPVGAESTDAGTVVTAPARITDFAPAESSVTVDASTVNLRRVFEDLGPEATSWYQHVQTLADPFFEGRAPGTRGLDLAVDYIEFYFRHAGLEPAFDDGSYRQPFEYRTRGTARVEVKDSKLEVNGEPLAVNGDYVVLGISGSGAVRAPVAFVGYGIAEGPDGYSSFDEDTDLSGRVALLLRYTPVDEQGEWLWSEADHRMHGAISRKMKSVTDRGAAAIILVNPPGATNASTRLEPVERSRRFGPPLGVPVVQVTPDIADRMLLAADPQRRGLAAWQRLADEGRGGAVYLDDDYVVDVETVVERKRDRDELSGTNVAGVLPGRGRLAGEWVIIGAHHDHVGLGKHGGVMPANRGRLHPGADDNASGTAGVLVLADMLSNAYEQASGSQDLRSILFITFDAEEMGLHGSRHFADHSPIRAEDMSLMLNMDMVGRLRSRNLSVLGIATGEGLADIVRPHFEASGLTVSVWEAGSGRSDDANFHRIGVPAMHFFTGMHNDYTSPGDQAFTVNPAGAREVLDLLFDIALDAATRPEKLVYQEPPPGPGQDRGYGPVRLGIRPGMGDEVDSGVFVDSVSEGTSAAEAGMLGGDVIIRWDDMEVIGLRDLFQRLQQHQPGDHVKITVLREGREVVLDVTLKGSER